MPTLPKTLLILAVVGFAISLTGPGAEFAEGIIKPISVLCFIGFYITQILAKEIEAYDHEQHAKLEWVSRGTAFNPTVTSESSSSATDRRSASLTGAVTQ
jgi:hypothetical protein